jgi:hypothetical protein
METSTCRSCGAPIIWVLTEAGKRMPLDAKPEKRWTIDPLALRLNPDAPRARLGDTHVSHFATCPNAAQHRKKP